MVRSCSISPLVRIFFCLIPVLFSDVSIAAETAPDNPRELIAAVPRDFPPQYQLDESGRPAGFAIDVMEAVAGRTGVKVRYRVEPTWHDTLEALREGRADLIPNLGITAERKEHFTFTVPVETFRVSLFVRDDTHDIQGLDNLLERKVAVVKTNVAVQLLGARDVIVLQIYPHL